MGVTGKTVTLRFQSTWRTKDILPRVRPRLRLRGERNVGRPAQRSTCLPGGAVVKAFDLIDAVNKGTLTVVRRDGLLVRQERAHSLFGTDRRSAWTRTRYWPGSSTGAWQGAVRRVATLDHEIRHRRLPLRTDADQCSLGWFKKQVKSPADLKNLKYAHCRSVGGRVQGDGRFRGCTAGRRDRAGASTAASSRRPSSTTLPRTGCGFPGCFQDRMLQSYHQPLEIFEILFNKKKYNFVHCRQNSRLLSVMPPRTQVPANMSWKAIDRAYSDYIRKCRPNGVENSSRPRKAFSRRNLPSVGQGGGDQEQEQCVLRQGTRVAEEIC